MLHSINKLAFRVPILIGTALLMAGCYTLFSHPESDLLTHDTSTDCESCHSTGFTADTFSSPYSYGSTPYLDYYEIPWWIPSIGGAYVEGDGSGSAKAPKKRGGRHVGSRGQRASTPPAPTATQEPSPSRSTTETKESDPAPEPAKSGQQTGRTMKKDSGNTATGSQKSGGDSGSKTKSDDPRRHH